MNEDARIREEIQERTGVSSRGFLIPQRKLREEVLGKLSAGNQPANISEVEERKTPVSIAPSEVRSISAIVLSMSRCAAMYARRVRSCFRAAE